MDTPKSKSEEEIKAIEKIKSVLHKYFYHLEDEKRYDADEVVEDLVEVIQHNPAQQLKEKEQEIERLGKSLEDCLSLLEFIKPKIVLDNAAMKVIDTALNALSQWKGEKG